MKSEIKIVKAYKGDDGENICLDVSVNDDYFIGLKWDGCINLWKTEADGITPDPCQYMHICDVTKFIDMLSQVEQFRLDNIDGAE